MKKVKRRSRLMALLLAAVMLALVPIKVQAAPPPTTTGVTQDTFDARRYADTYADLKKAFGYDEAKLWNHYLTFGIKEGRTVYTKGSNTPATAAAATGITQANFDARRYADTYADLKKAFGYNESLLWQHYQKYGIKEGRQAFAKGAAAPATAVKATAPAAPAAATGITQANFDARRYADTYADLKKAFGYDEAKLWNHYLTFGIKEGRQAFAKGAAAPATAVKATAPAAPAAAPAASGDFLSREGGVQIDRYAYAIGVHSDPNPFVMKDPGGGWSVNYMLPAGWKADSISFALWFDRPGYWECRAWNSKVQVPPIATAQARTLAEAQAFFNRFRP